MLTCVILNGNQRQTSTCCPVGTNGFDNIFATLENWHCLDWAAQGSSGCYTAMGTEKLGSSQPCWHDQTDHPSDDVICLELLNYQEREQKVGLLVWLVMIQSMSCCDVFAHLKRQTPWKCMPVWIVWIVLDFQEGCFLQNFIYVIN